MRAVGPVGVQRRRPGDQDFHDSHQRDPILRIYLCPNPRNEFNMRINYEKKKSKISFSGTYLTQTLFSLVFSLIKQKTTKKNSPSGSDMFLSPAFLSFKVLGGGITALSSSTSGGIFTCSRLGLMFVLYILPYFLFSFFP